MISVIGLGYIGLPTALMFAKSGHKVIGIDYNNDLVNSLNEGKLTFEEKGLKELFNAALDNGISFTTEYNINDFYIISVPTPFDSRTKRIEPKYIISAVNSVLDVCKKGSIIVIESTISPGTIDNYIRPLLLDRGVKSGEDVHLVHAPERIIPGNMVYELENNSRTIGADDLKIAEVVKEYYSSFCKEEIVLTDIRSAEMSKVVENTFRDINIAFANELAKICRADGMDVYEIIRIANKHPRVNILQPGPGVGGHCISVDPWFLVGDYPDLTHLILNARNVNDSMPQHVLERIGDIMRDNNLSDVSRIGLYGLTYKENVDDTRESPTLQLLELMEKQLVYGVKVYDPFIKENVVNDQYQDFDKFLNDIDVLVILVNHDHLKLNLDKLRNKHILDTKNVIKEREVYKL